MGLINVSAVAEMLTLVIQDFGLKRLPLHGLSTEASSPITGAQYQEIAALVSAGDRGGAYLKLAEYSGNPAYLNTAQISTGSGVVGGAAIQGNALMQMLYPSDMYPVVGIVQFSQAVLQSEFEGLRYDSAIDRYLVPSEREAYERAQLAWNEVLPNNAASALFPGRIFLAADGVISLNFDQAMAALGNLGPAQLVVVYGMLAELLFSNVPQFALSESQVAGEGATLDVRIIQGEEIHVYTLNGAVRGVFRTGDGIVGSGGLGMSDFPFTPTTNPYVVSGTYSTGGAPNKFVLALVSEFLDSNFDGVGLAKRMASDYTYVHLSNWILDQVAAFDARFSSSNPATMFSVLNELMSHSELKDSVTLVSMLTGPNIVTSAILDGPNGAAYQAALIELSPVMVAGGNTANVNTGAGNEVVTMSWLADRYQMLREGFGVTHESLPGISLNGTTYVDVKSGWTVLSPDFSANKVVFGDLNNTNVLTGSGQADRLYGGSMSDTLVGGAGADSLVGGGGNDVLDGGEGSDSYDGGSGDDWLGFTAAGVDNGSIVDRDSAANVYNGGLGSDRLFGTKFADLFVYKAGDGVDVIWANGGADVVQVTGIPLDSVTFALEGSTTLIVSFPDGGSIRVLNWLDDTLGFKQGRFTFNGATLTASDIISKFTHLQGHPNSNSQDILSGKLAGYSTTFEGYGGDDLLTSLQGPRDPLLGDVFVGGGGNDVIVGSVARDHYAYYLGDGFDTITTNGGGDTLSLGEGLNLSTATLTRSGNSLVMEFSPGQGMSFAGWFANPSDVLADVYWGYSRESSWADLLNQFNYQEAQRGTLTGNPWSDSLTGDPEKTELIDAGGGDDYIMASGKPGLVVEAGPGADYIVVPSGPGSVVIRPGTGNDYIYVEAGRPVDIQLSQGGGHDTVQAQSGANVRISFDQSYGTSSIWASQSSWDMNVSAGADSVTLQGGADYVNYQLRMPDGTLVNSLDVAAGFHPAMYDTHFFGGAYSSGSLGSVIAGVDPLLAMLDSRAGNAFGYGSSLFQHSLDQSIALGGMNTTMTKGGQPVYYDVASFRTNIPTSEHHEAGLAGSYWAQTMFYYWDNGHGGWDVALRSVSWGEGGQYAPQYWGGIEYPHWAESYTYGVWEAGTEQVLVAPALYQVELYSAQGFSNSEGLAAMPVDHIPLELVGQPDFALMGVGGVMAL